MICETFEKLSDGIHRRVEVQTELTELQHVGPNTWTQRLRGW